MHDAISVSILALLGGLVTPVMVSTGQDARDALFGYITVLDLGVLAVVLLKRWRALDIIACTGTMILYIGWFASFYSDSALAPAMLWLAVFFIIFLLAPFAYHLRRKTGVTIDRFLLALANATFTFVFSYIMLSVEHRHALGFVALIMSAGYVAILCVRCDNVFMVRFERIQ